MTTRCAVLLVGALTGIDAAHAVEWRQLFPPPEHQILLLGTFHFKDAGLDSYKPEHDVDILSAERQSEIDALLGCLAEYRPTKIALEVRAERQSELDADYSAFLAGDFELTSHEVHQLGFKLARRLGHERVYAVDAQGRWFEPYVDPDEWAEEHGQGHLLESPLVSKYEELYRLQDRGKVDQSLVHTLLELNDPNRVSLGHGRYLIENFPAGNLTEYPGVDSKTAWYNRNLRIFANLQRITDAPEERILLIIGAGHLSILSHAIDSSPEYQLTWHRSYLAYDCAPELSSDDELPRIEGVSELVYSSKLGELITREESWAHGYPRNDTDSSLLLSVRLRGTPNSYSPRLYLNVVARVGAKVELDRRLHVGSFNPNGEYTVPVFINGPFCAPVEMQATLETTDGLQLDRESFEVVYNCGE